MANFLEFLKSGKTAREFIDTAVLPQYVVPVTKTETSPEPYENSETGDMPETDIPIPTPADLENEAEEPAHDLTSSVLTESGDDPDADFLRQLETLEKVQ